MATQDALFAPAWPLSRRRRALLWHHLSALARTGLKPGDLRMLAAAGTATPGFALHAEWLARRVESGESLADAVASLEVSFDAADVAVVRAGERTGRLAEALHAWAAIERARAKAESVTTELVLMPLMTACITVLCAAVVGWKVVPTFATLYVEAGHEMPLATRLMNGALLAAPAAGALLCLPILAGLVAWLVPEALPRAAWTPLHRALLRMPGVRAIALAGSRWLSCETLASFAQAGLPPDEALRAAASMQRNDALADELLQAATTLQSGSSLSAHDTGLALDAALRRSLDAALSQPDAAAALRRLARRHELALHRGVSRFGALAPGIATLLVSLLAGLLAAGVYGASSGIAAGLP